MGRVQQSQEAQKTASEQASATAIQAAHPVQPADAMETRIVDLQQEAHALPMPNAAQITAGTTLLKSTSIVRHSIVDKTAEAGILPEAQ